MVAIVLLVTLTLMVHQLVFEPIIAGLQPLLDGRAGLWLLLLVGLWLFTGPRRSP